MNVYVSKEFKKRFLKLKKKPSYKDIGSLISQLFFDKNFSDLLSGARIHSIPGKSFIKKRLGGRGGFRIYYIAEETTENIFLLFIHPKYGPFAQSNIQSEEKVSCLRELKEGKRNKTLLLCEKVSGSGEISFSDLKQGP